jgi:arylsulfatase A-like enzyme
MSSDARDRPNILLILTDQQRWDSLGCYGADWVDTPNLDRLAREGVIFDNCYVNNTVCTPSRASIWTGKELPGHGVYRLYDELPREEVHFTRRLQEAGYRTALYGKLHTSGRLFEAHQRHPTDGFDEYEWGLEASIHLDSPFNGYSRWLQEKHPEFFRELSDRGRDVLHHPREVHFTHWAAERTIDFIRRVAGGEPDSGQAPFFCCMSVFDPHNPYEDYPQEMLRHVRRKGMPERLADLRRDRPEGIERERAHSYLGNFASFSEDEIAAMRLGYYASVALIDLEVGRVLDSLAEAGVEENTLVLFASDHGDMIGDHDLLVKGGFFYEGGVKVPLLMRWPRQVEGGTRVSAVVQPHDIAATVIEAAGLMTPEVSQEMPTSRNLLPLATGDVGSVRSYAVCAYRNSGICDSKRPWEPPIEATMVTDGQFKLSLYHGDGGELYDLKNDPEELHDLMRDPDYCHERLRLTESLAEWLEFHERNGLGTRGGERLPAGADQLDNRLKHSSHEGS